MKFNEIVVISGKGGTGKTTVTSSLIPYFEDVVIGDCDVDAPNLKILFSPKDIEIKEFFGMKKAKRNMKVCNNCGLCFKYCKFNAIDNLTKCEGCGVCEYICPTGAIEMVDNKAGSLIISDTSYGKLVHASLIPGEENSGKLVAEVRKATKKIAEEENKKYIILDGVPGVACNVISSITGIKKAVLVTEPTLSGLHDMERLLDLIAKFRIKPYFIINKYDLSNEISEKLENFIEEKGYKVSVKIPFEKEIFNCINMKKIPSTEMKEFFNKIGFDKLVEELKKD
ncbi:ATP-binding protein [Fusobacterium perfoetens]|uniref:ATP-binding protein n=1 Tax=Fusobacterium perfoetens TaxID=852 RepID=UPI0004886935|nr:ATP-binding protein [Fusobacterium perfoetens]